MTGAAQTLQTPEKPESPPNPTLVPQQGLAGAGQEPQENQTPLSVPLPRLAGNILPGNQFWLEQRAESPREELCWGLGEPRDAAQHPQL